MFNSHDFHERQLLTTLFKIEIIVLYSNYARCVISGFHMPELL